MGRNKGVPGYLHHKSSGRAFVKINGTNIYLGRYNTKESRLEYDRIIQDWLSSGRQFSGTTNYNEPVTVDGLCATYLKHARSYYRKNGKETAEVFKLEIACRLLHEHCGKIHAADFNRSHFKTIRQNAIELGWKRRTVNERMGHIKRVFKWAAQEDIILSSVYQDLLVVGGLKKGRSPCPESERILPVPYEIVEKTFPFCPSVNHSRRSLKIKMPTTSGYDNPNIVRQRAVFINQFFQRRFTFDSINVDSE